jgi:hypothetical protein
MLTGSPLPLTPDYPLIQLLGQVRPRESLGAWIRHAVRTLEIHCCSGGRICVSADLGLLLRQCGRVALRKGSALVILDAATVIQWRTLQVVTALPLLPDVERLAELFPGLSQDSLGLLIPIPTTSPEEVLAGCLAIEMKVAASHIVYSPVEPAALEHP